MKRFVIVIAAFAAGCSSSPAPTAPTAPDSEPAGVTLAVGGTAPPLPPLDWLRGEPVAAFQPGATYVLDFWATWCGPCLASFPESALLAGQYAKRNCVFVAVTAGDPGNTKAAVEEFVSGRGANYPFRWAFDADRKAYAAYMDAAGKNSIPTTFVIDRAGKLAWVGHPSELADVLPGVLAGTWDPKSSPDSLKAEEAALQEILAAVDEPGQLLAMNLPPDTPAADARRQIREVQAKNAKAALPKLAAFAKAHPARADRPAYAISLVAVHLAAGDAAAARPFAGRVIDSESPYLLGDLVDRWANPALNSARAFPEVATAAAAKLLAFDLPGPMKYIAAAKAAAFAGDTANRDKYLAAAMKGLTDPRQLNAIRSAVASAE